jgi:hypothetical protein
MKATSIILAAISFVTGLIAAWYWFKSSRVKIQKVEFITSLPSRLPTFKFETQYDLAEFLIFVYKTGFAPITVIDKAFSESSPLNTKASCWTALL